MNQARTLLSAVDDDVDEEVEQLTQNIRDMSVTLALKMVDKAVLEVIKCEHFFFVTNKCIIRRLVHNTCPTHIALIVYLFPQ